MQHFQDQANQVIYKLETIEIPPHITKQSYNIQVYEIIHDSTKWNKQRANQARQITVSVKSDFF